MSQPAGQYANYNQGNNHQGNQYGFPGQQAVPGQQPFVQQQPQQQQQQQPGNNFNDPTLNDPSQGQMNNMINPQMNQQMHNQVIMVLLWCGSIRTIWPKPTLFNFSPSLYKDNMGEICKRYIFSDNIYNSFIFRKKMGEEQKKVLQIFLSKWYYSIYFRKFWVKSKKKIGLQNFLSTKS
jgi:hypothetical protein